MPLTLRRSATALVALLLFCGCQGDETRITIDAYTPSPLSISMLHVRMEDGWRTMELGPKDFSSTGGDASYRTRKIPTRTRGTLRLRLALLDDAGDTVSDGAVELPLQQGWDYSISIRPDSSDPTWGCFGCRGLHAFGLMPAYAGPAFDSVYVWWGGNSRSDPVIY